MDGYGESIAVCCHIARAGHFVELFGSFDVAFRKCKVSHGLKEYSAVHASGGSFEVGVGRADVFFLILASSYIIMCVDRLLYIFLCRMNPFVVSLNISCASAHGEPLFVRIEFHILDMPLMRAIGM